MSEYYLADFGNVEFVLKFEEGLGYEKCITKILGITDYQIRIDQCNIIEYKQRYPYCKTKLLSIKYLKLNNLLY